MKNFNRAAAFQDVIEQLLFDLGEAIRSHPEYRVTDSYWQFNHEWVALGGIRGYVENRVHIDPSRAPEGADLSKRRVRDYICDHRGRTFHKAIETIWQTVQSFEKALDLIDKLDHTEKAEGL